jgi:hypothetical protein
MFGPDITKEFLDLNGLDLLIRSHEVKEEGYLVEHDGKCITVFSAPNYCDQMGNKVRPVIDVASVLTPHLLTPCSLHAHNIRARLFAATCIGSHLWRADMHCHLHLHLADMYGSLHLYRYPLLSARVPQGAMIIFSAKDMTPQFLQYDAAPHPAIPPMAYQPANMFGL